MTITSAAIALLLVMDPIGNSLSFMTILEPVAPARRLRVLVRELLIALGILLAFLGCGHWILGVMNVETLAIRTAGGIILFLVALRIIFPPKEGIWSGTPGGEPLIVPLATPLLAGPSAIATVLLLSGSEPGRRLDWTLAVLLAWGAAAAVLLTSTAMKRKLDRRLASGLQKLTGMILVILSVQMLLTAFRQLMPPATH